MIINADGVYFQQLNEAIRQSDEDVYVQNCRGQRYIGSALSGRSITVYGTPGNGLGAYLDGATVTVHGNAQDATGDTMNTGSIIVHGSAGDALGYAMRGGSIYVRGSSGYRTGIHMKEYQDRKPVIIVGGTAGSFLGEYMAGGLIVVLALDGPDRHGRLTGHFTGTGMHGGKIFIRSEEMLADLPAQVSGSMATDEEKREIAPYLQEYGGIFGLNGEEILKSSFCLLRPNAKNPYKMLYTPH